MPAANFGADAPATLGSLPHEPADPQPPNETLREVALRMERIKASAAAVRQAVQAQSAGRVAQAAAHTAFAPAEPIEDDLATGSADSPPPPEDEPPEPATVYPAPRRGGLIAADPFEATAPPRSRGHQAIASGEFTAAALADDDDALDDEGFGADDDFGDDDDAGLSGFGDIGPAPRPMPWRPILAIATVAVLVGAFVVRDRLQGSDAAPPPTDDATEVAEGDIREGSVAPPPQAVQPSAALPTAAPAPAAAALAPGTGLPVQPETVDAAPPAQAPDPAAAASIDEARALYAAAAGGSRKKNLEGAKALLEEVLADAPATPDALVLLAQVQLEQGDAAAALTSAERCTQLAAELADCWLTIGVLKQDAKDNPAAVEAYEQYLALAPDGKYVGDVQKQLGRLR